MSLLGVLIGFYGYLFPGNINLLFMQLYQSKKYAYILLCLLLAIVFETVYMILSLHVLKLSIHGGLYRSIQYASLVLLLVMSFWMLREKKNDTISSYRNTVARGLISIIIHPQQIPFWFIMGILLNTKLNLMNFNLSFSLFVAFNALGAVIAFFTYMIAGNRMIHYFNLKIGMINQVVGLIYMSMFIFEIVSLSIY